MIVSYKYVYGGKGVAFNERDAEQILTYGNCVISQTKFMVYSVLAHSTQIYFNGYPEITFFIMYIAVPITVRLGSESGAKQSAVLI